MDKSGNCDFKAPATLLNAASLSYPWVHFRVTTQPAELPLSVASALLLALELLPLQLLAWVSLLLLLLLLLPTVLSLLPVFECSAFNFFWLGSIMPHFFLVVSLSQPRFVQC